MAQIMDNQGHIRSRDIYEHKLRLIRENAQRLGIDIISTEIHDARILDEDLIGKDGLLPCGEPLFWFGNY